MKEHQAEAVRKEFSLFCKIGLDESIRLAVLSVPFPDLGLPEGARFCPREFRDRVVTMRLDVSSKAGGLEQIVHLDMKLGRFVRLRQFLERFDVEQVRALQTSFPD